MKHETLNGRTKRGKIEKALDTEIEREYYRIASGVEVNIMDIPRIFRDAKLEHAAGVPIAQALPVIVTRYRMGGAQVRP